jgi:outer membrane lipoprotein carrier protein
MPHTCRIDPMNALRLLFALGLAAASSAAIADARAQLDAFSKGLDGLRGSFVQTVIPAAGGEGETSRGTLALKAPQEIVADGLNVWIHDVDLEQVTVRGQSGEEAQSPLTVLTDLGLLERDYTVETMPDASGIAWLRLVPKAEEPAFKSCELGFQGNALARMVLTDHLGQRNELRFGAWERNPVFAADAFRFVVPEGTDLVGEPVEGAEAFPVRD